MDFKKEFTDLAKKYNISKPVFYIIDDIDFSDSLCTGIYGYNGVTIVITNCNFGELTNIRNDGACRLYYSKLNMYIIKKLKGTANIYY